MKHYEPHIAPWNDGNNFEPEAVPEKVSCFRGMRRLSALVLASTALVVYVLYRIL